MAAKKYVTMIEFGLELGQPDSRKSERWLQKQMGEYDHGLLREMVDRFIRGASTRDLVDYAAEQGVQIGTTDALALMRCFCVEATVRAERVMTSFLLPSDADQQLEE